MNEGGGVQSVLEPGAEGGSVEHETVLGAMVAAVLQAGGTDADAITAARNDVLKNLVRNDWVRFHVRDPYTQQIFEQKDGEYIEVNTPRGSHTQCPHRPVCALSTLNATDRCCALCVCYRCALARWL